MVTCVVVVEGANDSWVRTSSDSENYLPRQCIESTFVFRMLYSRERRYESKALVEYPSVILGYLIERVDETIRESLKPLTKVDIDILQP